MSTVVLTGVPGPADLIFLCFFLTKVTLFVLWLILCMFSWLL